MNRSFTFSIFNFSKLSSRTLRVIYNKLWFQQVAEVARETNELLNLLSAEGKERIQRSEWFYVASWTFLTRDIHSRDNI